MTYRQHYKGGAYSNPYSEERCGRAWQPEHPAVRDVYFIEPYDSMAEAMAFLDGVEAVLRAQDIRAGLDQQKEGAA